MKFLRIPPCRARLRCPSWGPVSPSHSPGPEERGRVRPPTPHPPRGGAHPPHHRDLQRITTTRRRRRRGGEGRGDADSHRTVTAELPREVGPSAGAAPLPQPGPAAPGSPWGGVPAGPAPSSAGGAAGQSCGSPVAPGGGGGRRSAPLDSALRSPHGGPALPPLRGGGGRPCRHFRGRCPFRKEARGWSGEEAAAMAAQGPWLGPGPGVPPPVRPCPPCPGGTAPLPAARASPRTRALRPSGSSHQRRGGCSGKRNGHCQGKLLFPFSFTQGCRGMVSVSSPPQLNTDIQLWKRDEGTARKMVFQFLRKRGGNTSERSQRSKSGKFTFFPSIAQAGSATAPLWAASGGKEAELKRRGTSPCPPEDCGCCVCAIC